MFRSGRRFNGRLVSCYALLEGESATPLRVGFAVPRRSLNAVQRNRVRRLMREAFVCERESLMQKLRSLRLSASLLFIFRPASTLDVRRLRLGPVRMDIAAVCLAVSRKLQ
ncbi:MAG: ribonuclease P protein component [Bacteroidetes bacterium]|nr:ribonuclease P protein component [Bacteroidota bacterium]